MDQIKSLITPSKFRVWVRHVESHTRDKRTVDTVVGSSYLEGVWDEEAGAYRATKYHIHPEFRYAGFQIDLFKAALELMSSAHKELITDDVITGSQREHIDEVIQQGHVRKDVPFGSYLLDSPGRKTMAKTAKSWGIKRNRSEDPPKLTRKTEGFIWSMGDALTRALREPQGGQTGDNRFWVSGLSKSSWSIKHPDLEILESGESPLIMRIKKVGDGKWTVEGQNQLQNLKNTEILATENTPPTPNRTWELDFIAARAADYFLEQKDRILELKETMQPQQAPGAGGTPPPPEGGAGGEMGGGGMPPMASRRARATLANLRKAEGVVTGLGRRYGSQRWFGGARVVNDRGGIGVEVRLRVEPGRRLKGALAGIPVEWRQGNRRLAAGAPEEPVVSPEEQEKQEHEERVRAVYKHLLEHRRTYSSVKYLAHVLEMDPHKLAKALGELIAQGRVDITGKKFKPVPPQKDQIERVSLVMANTSLYPIDKGNWRHNDQLDSTYNDEIPTRDAPEEENNAYSRIMPDPTEPN